MEKSQTRPADDLDRNPDSSGPEPIATVTPFVLGPFETNCYVVHGGDSDGYFVVDVGVGPGEMIEHLRGLGRPPEAILLTHAHADHIAGLDELRRAFPGVPVIMHPSEEGWLSDPMLNLSALHGVPVTASGPDRLIEGGETLELCGMRWRVMHTPGHSPGGIVFHHEASRIAIVGDTLFAGSIGRTDFPGSDHEALLRGIREHLYALPDDTRVLPGHGPETSVGHERKTNPFVRA